MSNVVGRPKKSKAEKKSKIGTIKLTPNEFIKWKKLGPDKIRNFLSNGHSKKLINKKDSKDVILSNLVSMIKREKDNIPMELVRGFELFFRTIKER